MGSRIVTWPARASLRSAAGAPAESERAHQKIGYSGASIRPTRDVVSRFTMISAGWGSASRVQLRCRPVAMTERRHPIT
jgi:hypothetical protein